MYVGIDEGRQNALPAAVNFPGLAPSLGLGIHPMNAAIREHQVHPFVEAFPVEEVNITDDGIAGMGAGKEKGAVQQYYSKQRGKWDFHFGGFLPKIDIRSMKSRVKAAKPQREIVQGNFDL